jgi:predicted branched-subunit amino acid permease
MVSQLYGTPLGLLVIVGGGVAYALLSKERHDSVDRRRRDESFSAWWRRRRLGQDSYDYWFVGAAAGVLLLIAGIVAGDLKAIGLAALMTVVPVCVLISRWQGRRPPR